MPVTFTVSGHPASPYDSAKSGSSYSQQRCPALLLRITRGVDSAELLQTSVRDGDLVDLVPSRNGFVYSCLHAYNNHQNLVIRPDDIWISIMSQFSVYVGANGEKMKGYFVGEQQGKKKLIVTRVGTRYSMGPRDMAKEMIGLLDKNVKDKSLRDWIVPGFSTTTPTDTIVGAAITMGTLKNYSEHDNFYLRGIPSVTLQGTKQDWQHLRTRIHKLLDFGSESEHPDLHAWYGLLNPIITNFIDAFDAFSPIAPSPERGQEITNFFQRICSDLHNGSGATSITGWLAFLCPFDCRGKWQLEASKGSVDRSFFGKQRTEEIGWLPEIWVYKIPIGFSEVDMEINDNGTVFETTMVAGMAGYKVLGENKDTLAPQPVWWLFVKSK